MSRGKRKLMSISRQATVLLATNVGLLSIQSVDNESGSYTRSAAQLCSYASTLLSLSNILAIYVLRRQFGPYQVDYYELHADMLVSITWTYRNTTG